MNIIGFLIPIALILGGLGVIAFIWCLRSNQYEDLEGAAWRILDDDDDEPPADRNKPQA
ncbi:MAG TPA: cbb3-type cytochrome oxidase assembly protein CcoS [Geminicoccus sp.]|jgi:cbb3-type cytochrome oxidase maturation protein|uniref:cbb3-type cytochrome oxidase assembly protein CcoS n=1 Tax=Geminicoccus sp. TaxID=2024832 RepID=UPI002E36030A|nr:cbb3-type cytochrome oxidase assembly protein CcoS [Geminicoccus sp.]HEX2525007.1 cbb3-type cytochrome oxidase assembly protein CcoS [Geminicoccus sp.]